MRGVIGHGVLLLVMLGVAYHSWTKDHTAKVSTGEVSIWDLSQGDLTAIELEKTTPDPTDPTKSSQRTVRIERRGEGGNDYWWGSEARTDAKAAASTSKREFPVGQSFRVTGEKEPYKLADLVHDFASMHAVAELPTPTDAQKKEYELAASTTTLAVIFKNKTRTLILGAHVSGSSERYALDPDSGKAYILAGALIDPFDTGEAALRPDSIHGFELTAMKGATVSAGGKSKSAKRITTSDDKGVQKDVWADAATGAEDETLDTFISNLERLIPQEYQPSIKPSDLTPVIAVTYADKNGKQIGVLGLYKAERPGDVQEGAPNLDPTNPPPPVTEYYVLTETTRVPAVVAKAQAERAEQDVMQIFEDQAAKKAAGGGSGSGSGSGMGTGTGAPTP